MANTLIGYCQNPPGTIGVGIVREKVDTSIAKQINVISTGFGKIVAFPADYSIRREADYPDSIKHQRKYFTPDSSTLLRMNVDLKSQYCAALRYQVYESYNHSLKLFGMDGTDRDNFSRWLVNVNSNCQHKFEAIDSLYKQVIAFDSPKYSGKVLYIQLIDFREDPYNLKDRSKKQMIDGWHGWFETHIESFFYHIEQRKLSVHGDNFKLDSR